jgi:hypothetical protein
MSLGDLERAASIAFQFDNNLNLPQRMLGMGMGRPDKVLPPVQNAPLRLEFDSVTGARCWTNVRFKVGGEGPVEPELEHGIDLPSTASKIS